jgi:hypothetical protein
MTRPTSPPELSTTTAVIDAIGYERVCQLTASTPQTVSNWRGWDHFPPNTFVVLSDELRRIRRAASASLWRMKVAPQEAGRSRRAAASV